MPGDSDIYRGQVNQRTPLNVALCAIWYRLWQITGFSNSGSGGTFVVANPATYNGAGDAAIDLVSDTAVNLTSFTAGVRKIDIVNTGAALIWVRRAEGDASAGNGYALAQYGVLSVDEPTIDNFSVVCPGASGTCYYIERTLAP